MFYGDHLLTTSNPQTPLDNTLFENSGCMVSERQLLMTNADWLNRSPKAVWHPCTQMKYHDSGALPLIPVASGAARGCTILKAGAIWTLSVRGG